MTMEAMDNGRAFPAIAESQRWMARARNLIPACTQTLAKGPTQWVQGVAPQFIRRAKAAHVWDVDGNEYIDLNMGIGPISLGYGYPRVDEAIRAQLADGITFSLVHPLEVEVAEAVREAVPCADQVRFSKTGADAVSAAVRVARAFTGLDRVMCCGYHGWHDWYIGVTSRPAGVPAGVRDDVSTFEYNDLASVEAGLDEQTACVVLEPMVFDFPKNDFLIALREICSRNGSLLIFDEMWTGFRWALGGAQEAFGVIPDLACFSKAVSNGMPLSILAGRADVMSLLDQDVFFFTTFGGEALSLAAAKATIAEMRERHVPAALAASGAKLAAGFNRLAADRGLAGIAECVGHPARTMIKLGGTTEDPLLLKSLLQQEMIRRGVLWGGFHNMCFSHTEEDIERVLDAYDQSLSVLRSALDAGQVRRRLQGEPVQAIFRKTGSFNMKPRIKRS